MEAITAEIVKGRLQKSGHILRLNEKVLANKVMIYYFTGNMKQSFRRKHRPTIVTQLNKDTNLVKTKYREVHEKFRFIKRYSNVLECVNDLQNFTQVAKKKMLWKSIVDYVYRAVEAD